MDKTSLKEIRDGYLNTLREVPGRPDSPLNRHDLLVQVILPAGISVLFGIAWPLEEADLAAVCSNVVTGVSIVSSLMCGVAVMLFQLRIQLALPEDIDASEGEIELIDETFSDVLWSVVAGFAAVVALIVGDILAALVPILHRVCVSVALGLVAHLAIVTCMGLKRLNASYAVVAKVWGKRNR